MVVQEQGSGTVLTAAATGLVAALAGGVVWALIVRWTDYEIGFVAWGIGFLVGTAVVFGGRNARGVPFQVVAVVLALAGIVIGKYLAFVWVGQDVLGDELGALGFDLPVFSTDTLDLWWDARDDIWGGWDLLWVGLAVVTAFRIPRHEREAPAEPQETGDAPPNRPETDTGASNPGV